MEIQTMEKFCWGGLIKKGLDYLFSRLLRTKGRSRVSVHLSSCPDALRRTAVVERVSFLI